MTEHLDYDSLRADIVRQGGEAHGRRGHYGAEIRRAALRSFDRFLWSGVRVVRDKQPRVPAAGGENACSHVLFASFGISAELT
jgi:hypothetical protein